jgi:hypothetical protein
MRIIRITNNAGVDYIAPYLLNDPDVDVESLVAALKWSVNAALDNTYILAAFKEVDEDVKVVGFLIAFAPENRRHTFIQQAWVWNKLNESHKLADRMFLALRLWTEGLGRDEIRGETTKEGEALLRRWNFKEISKTVSFSVSQSIEDTVLNRDELIGKESSIIEVSKETSDGTQQQQTEADKLPDSSAVSPGNVA